MAMSRDVYRRAFCALLPRGDIWRHFHDAESTGGRLVDALSAEWARFDARLDRLIDESDPRTCQETFRDWLRVYGLPDECLLSIEGLTEDQLRQALLLKIDRQGLTEAFYKRFGKIFGVEITVAAPDPFRATSRADHRAYDEKWNHTFVFWVNVSSHGFVEEFKGTSRSNRRVREWGIHFIECFIRSHAPAHVAVLFRYPNVHASKS